MFKLIFIAGLVLLTTTTPYPPQRKVITPANGAKPIGPYSPGLLAGNYLYASGQGVRDKDGAMPAGLAAQTRQCLENVKAIVEAAGLGMDHVVHMQLYLEKMDALAEVDRVYGEYFPRNPPARVVIGTAKMPTNTTVEMTAVAARDLRMKRTMTLNSLKPLGHSSAAVAVGERVYLSAVYGKDRNEAEGKLRKVLAEANLKSGRVIFRNEYGLSSSTAALRMNELPAGAGAAISAIVSRDWRARSSGSSSFCASDGSTIYCAAQADSAAGDLGVSGQPQESDIRAQVQAVMKKLQAGLAAHNADLSHVVATNVYLNDIQQFAPMNETYATFFSSSPPTRTTVQPAPILSAGNPPLVRISLVAVKE
jgi:2-iminobutanoate/2-iminopropanoate deaminase